MREKIVHRYYCDHCSKGMFKKPDMVTHEASCTLNPKRYCFLCNGSHDYPELVKAMHQMAGVEMVENITGPDNYNTTSKEVIQWLNEQVDFCPACVLSVLRQGHIFAFEVFDYKSATSDWWKEKYDQDRSSIGRTI